MILSREEILRRLKYGEIFRKDTWVEESIREASYVLRIAEDGLLLDGDFYDPGVPYKGSEFVVEPGKIAIFSTKEILDMPPDLVGKIGIRLDYALLGLTGLMGIQVDPLYGHGKEEERLFIRVANFGNEPVRLSPGDGVFTFELHQLAGQFRPEPKDSSWPRIKRRIGIHKEVSWSYVTRVQSELSEQTTEIDKRLESETKRLESETKNIRDYLQPLVMFGIFLVAVTILGVALTTILNVRDTPEVYVPHWVTNWGWMVLLGTLSFAAVMTGLMGVVTVVSVAFRLWKSR